MRKASQKFLQQLIQKGEEYDLSCKTTIDSSTGLWTLNMGDLVILVEKDPLEDWLSNKIGDGPGLEIQICETKSEREKALLETIVRMGLEQLIGADIINPIDCGCK